MDRRLDGRSTWELKVKEPVIVSTGQDESVVLEIHQPCAQHEARCGR
jgi:hypothetical protein